MLTATTSSPSLALGDLSKNQELQDYVMRLYTSAIDEALAPGDTVQAVIKTFLREHISLTGITLTILYLIGSKRRDPYSSLSKASLVEWKESNAMAPEGSGLKERGLERGKKGEILTIDEVVGQVRETLVASVERTTPDYEQIFLHWLMLDTYGIVMSVFRVENPSSTLGPFTEAERELLNTLAPHLARIVKLSMVLKLGQSGYEFFSRRTVEIVNTFGLTETEYQVLYKLVGGGDNAAIAKEMGVSVSTVKTHITHILQKTGCRNRNALLASYFSSIEATGL